LYIRGKLIIGRRQAKDIATVKQQFDAIIVGAGPAGSSAALALARAGLQVALIAWNVAPATLPANAKPLNGSTRVVAGA